MFLLNYEFIFLAKLIEKYFPDYRRCLNELQRYSASGRIDEGILVNIAEVNLKELTAALKDKDWKKMRQWVLNNIDNDPASIFRKLYDHLTDQVENIPNLILSGTAGVGKTTVARAMLEELEADYIVINGSMNGNIDTLRNEILNFASSVSFTGGRKYVILDEADYLNANSTQPALRNFMEEFSKNCGFILTCNYKNRIIDPLHSRCSVIDFKISKKDITKLAIQFLKRTQGILESEKITYDTFFTRD